MTKRNVAYHHFVPGSSHRPRSRTTFLLQMAQDLERQQAIGARIKDLRGLVPQPVIAERVGVTLRAYQAWEAGDSGIAWDNVVKLAKVLGVSTSFLLDGDEGAQTELNQLDRIESGLQTVTARIEQLIGLLSQLGPMDGAEDPYGLKTFGEAARSLLSEDQLQDHPEAPGADRVEPRREAQ